MGAPIIENGSNRPKPTSQDSSLAIEHVVAALRGLRFGTVTIVVQDGRVVQIERNEKTRLQKTE